MNTDVLIIGAGPTGLMLANQLARRGIRVMVVERNPGPSVQTKALGVQGRTLEIYSHLGIAGRAVELGKRASGADMWVKGKRAARIPLGDIGSGMSPYPFLLILGQDENERLLGEVLRDQGTVVQWNTNLVNLVQKPEGVTATLERMDAPALEVSARWVAGCDGARSTVRSLCNIPFSGAPYQQVFYVADTRVTGSMVPGELNVYLWPRGFHLFFPMRGADHWRVVGILPPELRGRPDLGFDAVASFVREEAGTTLSFQECSWFSTYQVHHRRADRFRDRRCFLLGDAAHIHSPLGAQGMNTGLQDAYNLAWKLALVISGQADEGLLDSYEIERIPVAQRLLRTTDQAFTFFVSERWLARVFRMRIFPRIIAFAMGVDRARKLAFRTISQIGIRYQDSPLSRTLTRLPEGAPKAGDRFPWLHLRFASGAPVEDLFEKLDDTRFCLILFGQALPAGGLPGPATAAVIIHAIADDPVNDQALARARIPKPSFYLLRPDGHVGLAGAQLDAPSLVMYLAECVQLRTAAAAISRRSESASHRRA